MRIQVIINDRAGTVVGADAETVADSVGRVLVAAGHDVDVSVVKPEQLERELERVVRTLPHAVVVGGGDGTARFAATVLLGTPTALGVLPLGTVNRLARDLGMPLDYQAAAQALAAARVRAIDAADVNGRLFLCNAILGLTTSFSRVRQQLRGKPSAERLRGYLGAVRKLLRSRRRMRIHISDGSTVVRTRVLSLVVANNAYAEEPSVAMRRQDLDGGRLAVYASKHNAGWRMAIALLRALHGTLSDDRDVVQLTSPRLTVDVPTRRSVSLSIDGEIEELPTPLQFSIRPRALNVLVPSENR